MRPAPALDTRCTRDGWWRGGVVDGVDSELGHTGLCGGLGHDMSHCWKTCSSKVMKVLVVQGYMLSVVDCEVGDEVSSMF